MDPAPPSPGPRDRATVAIEQLVDEYGGQLYSLGLRFCGNRSEAEDLVQEVFLQAFRDWAKFEGRSSAKTWLYTIAARTCQRMHRKRSGEPRTIGSLESLAPFHASTIAAELDDSLEHEIREEGRKRLEAEIVALPEEFRVPLILKEIVGFTVPEVARILGIEAGTARSRVHRARLKLRAAIDGLIPRAPDDAPPVAYDEQTCLDLLSAKQEALDRGIPFDSEIVCQRCRAVFASLDLTHEICQEFATESLPGALRRTVLEGLGSGQR